MSLHTWRGLLAVAAGVVAPFLAVLVFAQLATDADPGQLADGTLVIVFGLFAIGVALAFIPKMRPHWDVIILGSVTVIATIGFTDTTGKAWVLIPGALALLALLVIDISEDLRVATIVAVILGALASYRPVEGTVGAAVVVGFVAIYPTLEATRLTPKHSTRRKILLTTFLAAALWTLLSITSSIGAKDASLLLGAGVAVGAAGLAALFLWGSLTQAQWTWTIPGPWTQESTNPAP